MSNFDQLVEDYATSPVPTNKKVSGLRVALVVVGVSIALPAFLSGAKIGLAVGFADALFAFAIAGTVLTAISSLTAIVASDTGLTTYMLVQTAFGRQGAHLVNFLLALTMFGWFGVNAALFGQAVVAGLKALGWGGGSTDAYVILGSILMILTTIFGFKALDKLSVFAVPVLIVILIAIVVASMEKTSVNQLVMAGAGKMPLGLAISAVVGGKMVAATTMPDVARFLPNRRQSVWAMFLSYQVGAPLVLAAAAIPSLVTGEPDLMNIITGLGLGIWALVVMVFATWTSNAANLYSSGLSLSSIFTSVHRWKLTALAGVFGTVIALAGIVNSFITFLIMLGIAIPPIAGIYITHYFICKRKGDRSGIVPKAPAINIRAFVAWGVSSGVAFASANGMLTLTTVPACDAFVLAALLYSGFKALQPVAEITNDRDRDRGAVSELE